MRKLIALTLAAVLVMTALCGCNILEMGDAPTLPKLAYDESALTGLVEYVNGRTCRISILEGDSHYDAATEKRMADVQAELAPAQQKAAAEQELAKIMHMQDSVMSR